tara:strand:+ start:204 stop:341 length:138 start_codon:yes stop_codon:yes gene_type:complete
MPRQQFTITIEESILKKFKEYCEDKDINMSKRIERYMKKDLIDKY